MLQPKSAMSGRANDGRERGPSAYALVLSPVHDPMPIEISDPIPAASSPGRSTSGNLAPPRPAASMRMTAAMIGEAKMSAIDANMPAASTSRTTKRLLRRVEAGSPGEAAVSAMSDARKLGLWENLPASEGGLNEPVQRLSPPAAAGTLAAMSAADSAPGSPMPAGP